MLTFREYLDEAISEVPTKFGTNKEMDNGKITTTRRTYWTPSLHRTSFSHDGLVHHVEVTSGDHNADVSFRTARSRSDRGMYNKMSGEGHHDAAGSFGKVMHVVHHILDKKKIDSFKFSGASGKHDKLYARIVNNKHFQKHMSDHGWVYQGKDRYNVHGFERLPPR